ncbi:MAG: DUF4860 domain-containing protein [Oscillospiraceae bacterium]|nr:DUF4860 domain-containing protein [Oscillospiraceae bacterium]
MIRQKSSSHAISGLFVFLLLGIFAVFSTVMVLLGVKAYRSAVERTEAHNSTRISTSYIRSMLRAEDETEIFALETCEGFVGEADGETAVRVETLTLHHDYDGEEYVTRIYVYGGFLREWFTHAEEPFRPDQGEIVCPAEELTAEYSGSLLKVQVAAGGEREEVILALRAAGE